MRILVLWHDFPSPYWGGVLPIFNLLKYFSEEHNIALLSFFRKTAEMKWKHPDLWSSCDVIETVVLPLPSTPSPRAVPIALRNMLLHAISKKTSLTLLSPFYSPEMQAKLKRLLNGREFDLILTSGQMAFYVSEINLSKIVVPFDARSENYFLMYKNVKNPIMKISWLLLHLREKIYESTIYKSFDACIVVTHRDRLLLQRRSPHAGISVIPNGVDFDYFKPMSLKKEHWSLIFVGSMNQLPNIDGVLRFYREIYPLIKKEVPKVKLYIVGANPTKEIVRLTANESVIVTGYVEDIRPYLDKALVVIAPMFYGVGIKNKILEAMAMGKAIVTTTNGIEGIDAIPEKHVITADTAEEFAKRVIELLHDDQLRNKIEKNARKLVEEKYSWRRIANAYNSMFEKVVK